MGMMQKIAAAHVTPRVEIFQPGVSPLIGREGMRRAGVKHQCHIFPFACRAGVLPSGLFHPGTQLWRSPNMTAFWPESRQLLVVSVWGFLWGSWSC